MDSNEQLDCNEKLQKQSLIDCYRIALDFGLAAGNLAAEQVLLQSSELKTEA